MMMQKTRTVSTFQRVAVWCGAGLVVVVAGALLFHVLRRDDVAGKDRPDPTAQTREERLSYLASPEFGKLSVDDRTQYMRELRDLSEADDGDAEPGPSFRRDMESLTDEERQQLRANVGGVIRQIMNERVEKYFAAPEAERTAHLDAMIDQMAELRSRWRGRAPRGEGDRRPPPEEESGNQTDDDTSEGDGHRRHAPSLDRFRDRIETSDPAERARFQEFISALRTRMEERGIENPWHRPR